MAAGRPEVHEVIARARERRRGGRPTIFFLDEIHRFNKAQQDALLPAVEDGLVTLVGATTENPYFEVNSALLSRTQVYELHALEAADVEALLRRALDPRGVRRRARGRRRGRVPRRARGRRRAGGAQRARAGVRDGDAHRRRRTRRRSPTPRTRCSARPSSTTRAATSTTTTSRRGSRPRAAPTPTPRCTTSPPCWRAGEDPRFIARRMIILASEDVGNADPQALPRRGRRGPCGRARRAARVPVRARPGRHLPLARAEVERGHAGHRRRPRAHHGARRGRAARPAAQRGLPGGAQAGPRAGLRVPARSARQRERPGAPPRRPRGPAPLRAGRRGGRAARAAGGGAARAGARAVTSREAGAGALRPHRSLVRRHAARRTRASPRPCAPRWATRGRC